MKYYHDSQAESDERVNGVINIRDCTDVVQADLAKNYGFIIQVNQIVTFSGKSKSFPEITRYTSFYSISFKKIKNKYRPPASFSKKSA